MERERAQAKVLGSFMTYGPRDQAQRLAAKLGLAPEETLRRMTWMPEREVSGGKMSQRTWYFYAYACKVKAARDAAAQHPCATLSLPPLQLPVLDYPRLGFHGNPIRTDQTLFG